MELHPLFYKEWFPFMKENKERVIIADDFLWREVYCATMEKIKANLYDNIVIVGASHSGLSAAWLLLNGPATYKKNNSLGTTKW